MDALGIFFLAIFLIIITISTILFIKRQKKIGINFFKYKLIYFSLCLVSIASIFVLYFTFQTIILIDIFKLKIDNNTYINRITTMIMIIILNIIVNLYVLKFYSKRIYLKERKKIYEIDLIGEE